MSVIYILHLPFQQYPALQVWLDTARARLAAQAEWQGWDLKFVCLNFDWAKPELKIASLIGVSYGPLVISAGVSPSIRHRLRDLLRLRVVVREVTENSEDALLNALESARLSHNNGQPFLPRKYVAAVLLVRKLHKEKKWGGSHEKNYLRSDDLANGRGLPDEFKDIAAEVANLLFQKDLLIPKYGGGKSNRQKYALNPKNKAEIEKIIDKAEFSDPKLYHNLVSDQSEVPRDYLD